MLRTQPLEKAIEYLSSFQKVLVELRSDYVELLKVVDAEHAAISRSDLQTIESLVQHKASTSEELENHALDIRKIASKLQGFIQDLCRMTLPCASITDVMNMFSTIENYFSESSITRDAFLKILLSTRIIYDEFVDLRRITEPKIEMNKYLTERLLNHHQQSYLFWQEIARESTATYGDDGVQRQKVIAPLLRIKA